MTGSAKQSGISLTVFSVVIARLDRAIQYAAAYQLKRCRL